LQPNLFQPQEIKFSLPEGRRGPRLWIRRISLWENASTQLRDIPLREGVNVIWSPDLATNEKGATPHGSGKSTFCRLIRYCLGESHFANEDQRPLMQHKLPDGFVGAEVIIDGECWVVTRPIGMKLPSRTSQANRIEDTFDQLLVGTDPSTIAPIISDRFCIDYRNQVPDNLKADQVWDVLLAWLSRDQECRLDDVFDWRSKRSGSGSPAQELSLDTKLAVVRLAIGALSAAEVSANTQVRAHTRERDGLRQDLSHLDWVQKSRFEDLCERLSLSADRDPSDEVVRRVMIDRANEQMAKVINLSHAKGQPPSAGLQAKRKALQATRDEALKKLANTQALLNTLPTELSAARAEHGTEQARLESGTIVRCVICQVDIDEVKANGCGISLERCDLNAVKNRIALAEQRVTDLAEQQIALPATIAELESELSQIDRNLDALDNEFERLEEQLSETDSKASKARELVREASWFDRQMVERETVVKNLDTAERKIEGLRDSIKLERGKVAAAVGDLESIFQLLVAGLMPKGCTGRISLDGNGLHTEILLERGAGLSTAAVESFKIVAFDIAAMILAVNGKARIPPFLIHDSPREADLDAAIYSNLFDFALGLEGKASPPPFQYIITTTTAPSEAVLKHDLLCLKLSSTPAEERLFTLDF